MVDPMTSTHESKIAGATQHNADVIVEKIVESRVVDGWNGDGLGEMVAMDKLVILFNVRTVTYGGNYKFEVECPKCGQDANYIIDLERLPVHLADEDEGMEEPFEVLLPVCKKRVQWRFLRGKDEAAERMFKKKRAKEGGKDDITQTYQLARRLVSVDGKEVTQFGTALKFVKALHGKDSRTWTKATEDVKLGIEDQLEITCRLCGKDYIISLPLSTDFFRPEFDERQEASDIFAGDVLVSYGRDHDSVSTSDGTAGAREEQNDGAVEETERGVGGGEEQAAGEGGSDGDAQADVAPPVTPPPDDKPVFEEGQGG
jgi:hypothetical protein